MDDPTAPASTITRQGAALVEMVIERVRADPFSIAQRKVPASQLETMASV